MKKLQLALVSAGALVLSACGGGGGGGSTSGTTPTAPTGAVTISSANADDVAANVSDTTNNAIVGSDLGSGLVTGVVVSDTSMGLSIADLARQQSILAAQMGTLVVPVAVTGVKVTLGRNELIALGVADPCPDSTANDAITVTWNDNDNGGLGDGAFSSGDTLAMTFSNCRDNSFPLTLNGSVSLSNLLVQGDPGTASDWRVDALLSFNALAATDGVESLQVDGDMNLSEVATASGQTVSTTISGSSLTTTSNATNVEELTNYLLTLQVDSVTGPYIMTLQGTVSTTQLGGSVDFDTITAFTGTDITTNPPDAGVLSVTGASGSQLRLTAMPLDAVELEVDADGDGVFEQMINTTWAELDSLI